MIDYKLLDESVRFYEAKGFERIETPWMVSQNVDNLTKPAHINSFKIEYNQKCLVASGEQSFLYLYQKDFLPKGRFQTITPCFRQESFDELHSNTFMKNELIITIDPHEGKAKDLAHEALEFFQQYIPAAKVVTTPSGWDVMVEDCELGSYGYRECNFLKWVYGTACAEPRLSTLIRRFGKPELA